jgi:hypothetical protein
MMLVRDDVHFKFFNQKKFARISVRVMEKQMGTFLETGRPSAQEVVMPSPEGETSGQNMNTGGNMMPEATLDPLAQSNVAQGLAMPTVPAMVSQPPAMQPQAKPFVLDPKAGFDVSWVTRMRSILNKVRNNPKGKVEALDKLKAEYKKKHFNHDSPLREARA